jgi:D-alanyl-D-alanine carboxypeptidase
VTRVFAIVALLLQSAAAGSQSPVAMDAALVERVDAGATRALSQQVAGLSVAVAREGRVVLARGYGVANLEHAVTVTPETVFHIASISKNIEAAVVLRLADEGKLRLEDDVTAYVPEAPTGGHHVTVRQLLNHTSGISNFTSLPEAADNERRDLTHEQVLALIRHRPLDFEPGTDWRYDNSAFYLAGMVVERVTKQEYGAYLREQIFTPLGMTSASLCDTRAVVPHLASGYEVEHGTLVNAAPMTWKLPFAAGAVCATATDLLTWQAALDAGRVVGPASLALMRTPTALPDGTRIDYGLGTRLGSLEGHRVIGHTGSGGGFAAALESFPDDHLTIVVLANTDPGSALALSTSVARDVLGLPERALRDLPVPKDELAALPGTFDSDEGAIELFARGDRLRARPGGMQGDGAPLLRQAENTYAIDPNNEVHFVVRNGQATWGVLYAGGLMLDPKHRVR